MPITVERDDAGRRFYAAATGDLTRTDILTLISQHRVGAFREYAIVFDASTATSLPSSGDIDALVSQVASIAAREGGRGPVAIVGTGAIYGVARMYEIKCDLAGIDTIRAFQSVSDAEEWLARAQFPFLTDRERPDIWWATNCRSGADKMLRLVRS